MDVYEPIYPTVIVLIGLTAILVNKVYNSVYDYDNKIKDVLQKINDTEYNLVENEKDQYNKIIENIIINKLYSSSIDTLRIERHNMHTICKYYDVKISIRYDKYYSYDIGDGREYLYISLMDYYRKNTQHFITGLFNKYVIDIKLFIDLYHIDIDFTHHNYTITYNRYTVKSRDYIPKLVNMPYDNTVIDNENVFIKLLSKIVEENALQYFFIHKHTGKCELLFTNGIHDISLDTYDIETSVSTRYFYA